jgi:hypothetical protein
VELAQEVIGIATEIVWTRGDIRDGKEIRELVDEVISM